VDRCALFVDASYVLADGAMAVHGTRHRDSVSWDYPGLLKLLSGLARDRTGLPLLRCYWYEPTVEGRRTEEHDMLADLQGLKLRLARIRPGNRGGVETELRRDLTTLARNRAISDAVVISAEDNLTEVIAEVQDLGVRVVIVHVTADGKSAASRTLRQECDDVLEVSAAHLRPFVDLIAGAEPVDNGTVYRGAEFAAPGAANGHGNGLAGAGHGSAALAIASAGGYAPPYPPEAPEPRSGPRYPPGSPEARDGPRYPENPSSPGARDEPGMQEGPVGLGEARAPGTAHSHSSRASRHAAMDLPGPGLRSDPGGALASSYGGTESHAPAPGAVQADRSGRGGYDGVARGQHDIAGQAGYGGSFDQGWPAQAQPGAIPAGPSAYHRPGYPAERATAGDGQHSPPRGGIPYGAPGQDGPYGLAAVRSDVRNGLRDSASYPLATPDERPSGPPAPAQPDLLPAAVPQFLAAPPPDQPGAGGMRLAGPAGPVGQPAQAVTVALADAVQAAHGEGFSFGESVARDAPALWLEAVLARKPRMPSDLEARLLQGSSLPIDSLLHDDVRHALRRGFWDALERARR